jgi:RNA polymerase sigma-70 factor (ECF subfamily)
MTVTGVDDLLMQARRGDASALGPLLERYRGYLTILARVEIGRHLQSKLDASDVVQETFLEAHRHFERFRGADEAPLRRWLRQILAATLAGQARRYLGTRGRDVRLEQQLGEALDHSESAFDGLLAASLSSPSQQATRREQSVLLADALAALPEDYREVIVLRHLEGLTFPEVARRLGRSLDSVEKVWLRALGRLRQALGGGA